MQQEGSFLYFFGILILFCAILFLAWLTTRLVGRRMTGERRSKLMRIVETLPLGMDRNLVLVRVGDKHYLLATSRNRTDFMGEVQPGEIPESPAETAGDFRSILERYAGMGRQGDREPERDASGSEERPMQAGIRRMRKLDGTDRTDR